MMKNSKLFYLLILSLFLSFCKDKDYNFKTGDIIFQTSKSRQSKAIQIATKSKYSHVGIIFKMKNKFYVYEAISTVRYTELNKWIKRGVDHKFVVKRLKNYKKLLTSHNISKMIKIGKSFKGKKYDLYFEWTDDRIYCSELVWKIYYRGLGIKIGKLKRLKDFDLTSEIVKSKLRERYSNNIPLNMKVISPSSMFNSDKLITVFKN